jgi:putative SOS response-associated peptidase YedK
MCSRYFLDAEGNVIAYTFAVPEGTAVKRRYNIAPTQDAPVVRMAPDGARELRLLRWGLVPPWARDLGAGTKMINARSEGVESKPAFRAAFRERRCLVPATGFYEWKGAPGRKQPYAITLAARPLFAFAGLWESWQPQGGAPVQTFAILTTQANEAVASVHDRMPVILEREHEAAWLTGSTAEALAILKPHAGEMRLRAVNRAMGSPSLEGPECLADAGPGWGEQQELL